MGLKETMIPIAFGVIAVLGIAISLALINTFLKLPSAQQDANARNNFNFAIFLLVASILGLGVSGYFAFKAFKAPSAEAMAAATAAASGLPNIKAVEAVVPSTEQITDPTALPTPNAVRKAQQNMNVAINGLIEELGQTKATKNQQLQAKLAALIQAAQAAAASQAAAV